MKNDRYTEFLEQAESFVFAEKEPQYADIIFVPGNGYPQMAEQAADLYKKGYAPFVLPSGRYSIVNKKFSGVLAKVERYNGKYETEWDFLRDVLIKNGVPQEKILREDQATFTYENAQYSRKVTDAMGLDVKHAILCCKTYHARRSLMYYQLVYPDTEFFVVPVDADGITKENWKETEKGVEAVTGEIGRIVKQFSLMI